MGKRKGKVKRLGLTGKATKDPIQKIKRMVTESMYGRVDQLIQDTGPII